ncbi:MAG: hypothetical protein IJ486_09695 [Firmicutes bacterium]|nr:hypothetical protein [Bacillota bacterium]
MSGTTRHYFPGNNTAQGFFSYYPHILDQRQARKIYCLKGGPGLGKSTLMRQIGEALLKDDEDVDFLHCSSDPDSLDGILIRSKGVLMVDGTSPHIVDPVNPGAVDTIVHLGDYWNEDGIRKHRQEIIDTGLRLKTHYARAYGYLGAAGTLHKALYQIYDQYLNKPQMYKKAASIINRELTHKKLASVPGTVRKQFASALTPKGHVNFIPDLMSEATRVYLIEEPVGMNGGRMIQLFLEQALQRGYDAECYYCAMDPSDKPEHLYIPQIKTAFVSSNDFHPLEPRDFRGKVSVVDMHKWIHIPKDDPAAADADSMTQLIGQLVGNAFRCFRNAKADHDMLEEFYIPHMDFSRLDPLKQKILSEIRGFERI